MLNAVPAFIVMGIIAAVLGGSPGYLFAFAMAPFAIYLIALILAASTAPKCPRCKARYSVGYRHSKLDGTADRRFKNNPYGCSRCGWRK